MNKLTEKLANVWGKLKKIKHIEIYIAVIFAVIVLGIYLSTIPKKKSEPSNSQNSTENSVTFSSSA